MFILSQIDPRVGIPLAIVFLLGAVVLIVSRMRGSTSHRRPANRLDVFTIADVAETCGVSEQEVRQWIENGLVVARPSVKVVLILKKDLDKFFEDVRV